MSKDREAFGQALRRLRREKALSQMDLAARSQTTQRYVSFLENGRAAPGRDVVSRLINALDLGVREGDVLLTAAGYAAALPSGAEVPVEVRSVVGRVLRQQEPFPALLLDTAQNILDSNGSLTKLLAFAEKEGGVDLSAVPGRPNLLRLFLHEAGLFPFLVEPGAFVTAVLGRVLREARGDAEALAVVSEVSNYPHVRRIASSTAAENLSSIIPERYRIGGTEFGLVCLVTSVGVPGSAEAERLRIEQFHPAEDASDAIIQEIAGG